MKPHCAGQESLEAYVKSSRSINVTVLRKRERTTKQNEKRKWTPEVHKTSQLNDTRRQLGLGERIKSFSFSQKAKEDIDRSDWLKRVFIGKCGENLIPGRSDKTLNLWNSSFGRNKRLMMRGRRRFQSIDRWNELKFNSLSRSVDDS